MYCAGKNPTEVLQVHTKSSSGKYLQKEPPLHGVVSSGTGQITAKLEKYSSGTVWTMSIQNAKHFSGTEWTTAKQRKNYSDCKAEDAIPQWLWKQLNRRIFFRDCVNNCKAAAEENIPWLQFKELQNRKRNIPQWICKQLHSRIFLGYSLKNYKAEEEIFLSDCLNNCTTEYSSGAVYNNCKAEDTFFRDFANNCSAEYS